MEPWASLILQVGFGTALAIFLVKYTTDKQTKLEDFVQSQLLGVIQRSNEASATTAKAITDLCAVLSRKPCLYELDPNQHTKTQ